ncbi:hypothetical protein CDL15_Pgr015219 [Punica granatum]|uniref:Uncharacterized protein n=1 Tax=Punica granatum TaxID=22663 RepID=A0A218VZ04_PUNGR|nr:hypothetical protein CDL15_Pgr015219 [Punica granatum]
MMKRIMTAGAMAEVEAQLQVTSGGGRGWAGATRFVVEEKRQMASGMAKERVEVAKEAMMNLEKSNSDRGGVTEEEGERRVVRGVLT